MYMPAIISTVIGWSEPPLSAPHVSPVPKCDLCRLANSGIWLKLAIPAERLATSERLKPPIAYMIGATLIQLASSRFAQLARYCEDKRQAFTDKYEGIKGRAQAAEAAKRVGNDEGEQRLQVWWGGVPWGVAESHGV